ncbi:MAG: glycerophosphodiester phosphodiesterase family protein [Thermodesulfobacteriota bacterium]
MKKRLICFAHRGASGHAPENTLAAFRKAVELGAEWIELDVYAVRGELLVIHDHRLERTTSGRGYVTRRGLDYLRSLDAGNGEKIPFLSEVLEAAARKVKINIELKGPKTAAPVCELLTHYVRRRGWRYDDFLLSSFEHRQLRQAARLCPEIRVSPNLKGGRIRYDLGDVRPYSIHFDISYATPEMIEKIHQRGCPAFVFTANTLEDIRRLEAFGADGVFTNYPELITRMP